MEGDKEHPTRQGEHTWTDNVPLNIIWSVHVLMSALKKSPSYPKSIHLVICVYIFKHACRCAHAGRRGDRHGGGPVSQPEPSAHRHLQCQLGPGGRRQNGGRPGQARQRSLPARSDRGLRLRASVCLWERENYFLSVCGFHSALSNWTVQAWEDTSRMNKAVFDPWTIRDKGNVL